MPDLLTLAPGVEVVRPDDGTRLRYSEDEVALVRDFSPCWCSGQNEWAGQPFVLSAWEEEAIRQFYGVRPRTRTGPGAGTGGISLRRSPRRTANQSSPPVWASTT